MTISKLLPLCACLMALAACEPHDPNAARAFYDPHYEHQLHAEKVIPTGARLYYEGSHTDPVLAVNLADPANYLSGFRGTDHHFPENVAKDVHFPEPHHGEGGGHGHGEVASPAGGHDAHAPASGGHDPHAPASADGHATEEKHAPAAPAEQKNFFKH
jgi:hypothetical protein